MEFGKLVLNFDELGVKCDDDIYMPFCVQMEKEREIQIRPTTAYAFQGVVYLSYPPSFIILMYFLQYGRDTDIDTDVQTQM